MGQEASTDEAKARFAGYRFDTCGSSAPPGKTYLLVDVVVENIQPEGSDTIFTGALDWDLVDGQGRSYDMAFMPKCPDSDDHRSLRPGVILDKTLVFVVEPEATDLEVAWRGPKRDFVFDLPE